MRQRLHLLLASPILIPLVACAPAEPFPVAFDLVERFPLAEIRVDTGRIDFGTTSTSENWLEGWSVNEKAVDGSTFAWATGNYSTVRIFIGEPRHLSLRLRCWPFAFVDSPPQSVTVTVNGNTVTQLSLQPRPHDYQIDVPARVLSAGDNSIRFDYTYSRAPSAVSPASRDRRELAVAWDWIEIEDHVAPQEPRVGHENETAALIVPVDTRVDYYMELAPGSRLELDGLKARQTPAWNATLRVEFQSADESTPEVFDLSAWPWSRRHQLPLPVSSRQMARISFRTIIRGDHVPAGADLTLFRPTIRAPASADETYTAPRTRADHDARPTVHPNIVIYLVDTLRADHLGCYGYPRPISPHIDAFAEKAILFARASAQSSWTRASVASIFTGLRPPVHGTNGRQDTLGPAAITLAEVLKDDGYRTAGFVTNGNVAAELGFAQGFDLYDYEPLGAQSLNLKAFRWLDLRPDRQPFFLYLHSIEPHAPYLPPANYRLRLVPADVDPSLGALETLRTLRSGDPVPPGIKQDLLALYDAEIAANDDAFGALMQGLRERQLLEPTLILFVADHGEEFQDHNWWDHGSSLYSEQLRVPLIVKLPGQARAGLRVNDPAQQIDILPTILDVLGRRNLPHLPGRSLLTALDGTSDTTPPAVVLSYLDLDGFEMESVESAGMKLIRNVAHDRLRAGFELYDTVRDPAELRDLSAERPVVSGYLRTLLRAHSIERRPAVEPGRAILSDELRDRLRSLGYLD